MLLHHLRSATAVLTYGGQRLLVDPMLGEPGAMPGFKLFGGGRRRNPLVPLPASAAEALDAVTGVLITHEHPDHFDQSGVRWTLERGLPVYACSVDAPHLRTKGLDVRALEDGVGEVAVEVVPVRHGRGFVGWMMGPVASVYLAHPDEPSLYLTSDAILTDELLATVDRLRPDVLLAPAGAANFGAGGDILFSVDELVTLARRAPGAVVLNHLEALDHCPTTRAELRARLEREGLSDRVRVPDDGEALAFERADGDAPTVAPQPSARRRPGFQKWLTAKLG